MPHVLNIQTSIGSKKSAASSSSSTQVAGTFLPKRFYDCLFLTNCNNREPSHFKSMEIRSGTFSAFIDVLTNNTYVMVVTSDSSIRKFVWTLRVHTKILNNSLVVESAVTLHNISVARKHFKLLEIDRA